MYRVRKLLNWFFGLLILVIVVSCQDTEVAEPTEPSLQGAHVITENGYGCATYSVIEFLEENEAIERLLAVDDVIYFTNFDHQIKAYSITTGLTQLLVDSVTVNEIEQNTDKIYFCTLSGIFSVEKTSIDSFKLESSYSCNSLEVSTQDDVLFMGLNYDDIQVTTIPGAVYKLVSSNEVSQITESVDDHLFGFKILPNNSILAYNSGNTDKIYRFNSVGALSQVFTIDNAPLSTNNFESNIWSLVADNRFLCVLKNGVRFATIIEWDESDLTWHSYLDGDKLDMDLGENSLKRIDLITPSFTDISRVNEYLYISTTLASCRGVQRIKLTPGKLVELDEIEIIRDANISIGHCIQGIQFDHASSKKYLYSQNAVMALEGCN